MIAVSTYGTVREVVIRPSGLVFTASGVVLGDVEGMERLGWEFTDAGREACKACNGSCGTCPYIPSQEVQQG